MLWKNFAKKRKSQIWVETVIYTVIGLTIIAIVLSIANPAIARYRDKIVIEQTIDALIGQNSINEKILEVKDEGAGNKRIVEFRLKKGSLIIDPSTDKIIYTLEETGVEYSEVDKEVSYNELTIKTEKTGKKYKIILTLSYLPKKIDIIYAGEDTTKTFNQASIPYKISIANNGIAGDKVKIELKEE